MLYLNAANRVKQTIVIRDSLKVEMAKKVQLEECIERQ